MPKDMNISLLFDFYGEILTEKQQDVIDYYYNDDLSLAEISEHLGITRQGVRDSIKRGEVFLYELEDKLHMFENYIDTMKAFQEIGYVADRISKENMMQFRSRSIEENVEQIQGIARKYIDSNS